MKAVRLVLTILGFVLAVVGALRDDRRIVWAAIVALVVALGLRLIANRKVAPPRP